MARGCLAKCLILFAVHANLARACNTALLAQCQAAYAANQATGQNICPAVLTYQKCVTDEAATCPNATSLPYTNGVAQAEMSTRDICQIGCPEIAGAPKNKLTLALWEMFLGAYGADRFYLGNIGTGIMKLITCGGCMIWALIDMIGVLSNALKSETYINHMGMQACFETTSISGAKTVAQIHLVVIVVSCCCYCLLTCITGGVAGSSRGLSAAEDSESESE